MGERMFHNGTTGKREVALFWGSVTGAWIVTSFDGNDARFPSYDLARAEYNRRVEARTRKETCL